MKKVLIVITVLFFGIMLFLTCFAERIHEAVLPHVTIAHTEDRLFPFEYMDENGNMQVGAMTKNAIPENALENGVYVIFSSEKNGTKRDFVRFVQVQTGMVTDDGYVEVVSGIDSWDRFVDTSTGELSDGCEVIIIQQ